MISYREKELLMVQKMIADKTAESFSEISSALSDIQNRNPINSEYKPQKTFDSYADLVEYARSLGYDTFIRTKDLLSKEEMQQLKNEYDEIDKKFKEITKLHKVDYAFMFSAVGLIIVKQFFLKLNLEPDLNADQTDGDFHSKYDNEKDDSMAKRYYAPMDQIQNSASVPYDVVKGTSKYSSGKETGLGLNPNNHRYRSVGHDPALGLIFGTGNILTNTATFYDDSKVLESITKIRPMSTYHIGYSNKVTYTKPHITTNASTTLMLSKMVQRIKDEPKAFFAALVKEIEHIKSDENSIAGIPIPFLTYFLGSDKAQELAKKGLNFANLKVVAEQAMISEMINFLVSFFYRIYCIWNEIKNAENWKEKLDVIFHKEMDKFDEVKSRKIIMYSNLIASTTNLIVCGGGAAISTFAENPALAKDFLQHLDIGGYLVTIRHLFTDNIFIAKVKKEFIEQAIQSDFEQKLNDLFPDDANLFEKA